MERVAALSSKIAARIAFITALARHTRAITELRSWRLPVSCQDDRRYLRNVLGLSSHEQASKNRTANVRVAGAQLLLAWLTFVGRVPWQVFVTLTFDPKRVYPVGCRRAEREAEYWCQHIARTLRRRDTAWVIAPERGASGQWHVHVLLVGVRHLSVFAHLWQLRNGMIDVRPVRDETAAVLYTTKQAALLGHVSLSPTVAYYRNRLTATPRVLFHPADV